MGEGGESVGAVLGGGVCEGESGVEEEKAVGQSSLLAEVYIIQPVAVHVA